MDMYMHLCTYNEHSGGVARSKPKDGVALNSVAQLRYSCDDGWSPSSFLLSGHQVQAQAQVRVRRLSSAILHSFCTLRLCPRVCGQGECAPQENKRVSCGHTSVVCGCGYNQGEMRDGSEIRWNSVE